VRIPRFECVVYVHECQVVEDVMVSKDASVHTTSLKVKLFVLHYHDCEEASKKQVYVCVCVCV
jgi:hypothetical protein